MKRGECAGTYPFCFHLFWSFSNHWDGEHCRHSCGPFDGGPGVLIWPWISSLFSLAVKYSEGFWTAKNTEKWRQTEWAPVAESTTSKSAGRSTPPNRDRNIDRKPFCRYRRQRVWSPNWYCHLNHQNPRAVSISGGIHRLAAISERTSP